MAALFFFSMAVQLAGTWLLPLVDRDETYYAEVTREMNARDDLVVPYYNNKFWLEKPPLLYWCQSLSFRLFGENAFAARFPAVLATALTALVVYGFCASIYDARSAWRAAVCYVLCLELLIYGRAGIPDMFVVLFTTLAAWAGWELLRGSGRKRWWWVFYFSLTAIALAKGPLAIIPALSVTVFAGWSRQGGFFRIMKWGRGLALSLALAALWTVPVLVITKGEFYSVFIGEHVLSRSVTSMQGHGTSNLLAYLAMLPLYVLLLLPAFLPWSFYLVPAFRRMRAQHLPADLYLASGILVTFVLFSVANTKLPHYTLPAFPLLACAVAPSIPERRFVPLAAGMVAVNLVLAFVLFPMAAANSVPSQLASSPLLRPDMAFATVEFTEPSLIWQMRKQVKAWMEPLKPHDVVRYMEQPGPRFCVLPTAMVQDIPLAPDWKVVSAHGLNLAKGRPLDLSMLVKTDASPAAETASATPALSSAPAHE
jgi:4-amino-4-deoxy-L-arabinose transferase-like glycosyltransferase